MRAVLEYFKNMYPALMILAAVIVMITAAGHREKHDKRIHKAGYIIIMVGLTFLVSILEYAEIWIDEQGLDYHLLYYKAMLIYWIYPAIALILLYMICDIKHKFLFAIPLFINMIITAVDLTGSCIVYYYGADHRYNGGILARFPFAVEVFYIILIGIYSISLLSKKNKSKGSVVAFMVGSILLAQLLEIIEMPSIYMPTIVAANIFIYNFYLEAINYFEIQEKLYESQLALEQNRSNLLLAQIRPHFINSNLAVIRSLCYEDPKKAIEMIDHFSEYLQENIGQIDDMRLVPFEKEMESVDNYLYLEMQRFPGRIEVVKELSVTDFSVPPLSIQTIVENAVRHGISMKGEKGTIRISTQKKEFHIIIQIEDDGKGFDVTKANLDGSVHVGIKNVKDRFRAILNGQVTIESSLGVGTRVMIDIPFPSAGCETPVQEAGNL
ncbi:MAG: histidine kinase [Parasporobacterium sp.]|nr:histidine kinase [Parasporobacterium sp.]